jgi:hypothetical protein
MYSIQVKKRMRETEVGKEKEGREERGGEEEGE